MVSNAAIGSLHRRISDIERREQEQRVQEQQVAQKLAADRQIVFETGQQLDASQSQLLTDPAAAYALAIRAQYVLFEANITSERFSEFADKDYVAKIEKKIQKIIEITSPQLSDKRRLEIRRTILQNYIDTFTRWIKAWNTVRRKLPFKPWTSFLGVIWLISFFGFLILMPFALKLSKEEWVKSALLIMAALIPIIPIFGSFWKLYAFSKKRILRPRLVKMIRTETGATLAPNTTRKDARELSRIYIRQRARFQKLLSEISDRNQRVASDERPNGSQPANFRN